MEHLKQCCTQNSERLLQMAVNEKRQVKKDREQRRGCCFGGQMRRGLGGSPGITKSGRVRKKRLEKRSLEFDYAAVESLG